MSTTAQQDANRQNAQSSSGPVSPEGKAASSRNATKHGLASAFVVLPHEDQAEFDALRTSYHAEFEPTDQHETFLIDQMVQSRWRLARIQRLETALLDQMMEGAEAFSPDSCIVSAMSQKSGSTLSVLQRYAATAERSYHKAHRELIQNRTTGEDYWIIKEPEQSAPPVDLPNEPNFEEFPDEPDLENEEEEIPNEPNPPTVAVGDQTFPERFRWID